MLPATLVSPSDIKPVLGVSKSILGTFRAQQAGQLAAGQQSSSGHTGQQATSWDHQQPPQAGQLTACTTGHQQATACQHWAELGRSADQAKNPAKAGQKQARSKGKNALLMTLYIFSEKSIIQLFHYCMYTALYNHSTTFSLLYMYSNTKSLHKNDDFLAYIEVNPPPAKNFRPLFFPQPFWLFSL
jgi:hypothetical protein